MWLKIVPDMDLNMEVELQGIDEDTRDHDVQRYEHVVRDALRERLRTVFADEDVHIYAIDVGIAREKYIRRRAA
jgi:Mn-dependent DtxR family transcriptional regulator